ncbi:MAG: TlpA disulfide reductase family protein [Prolixibacteraceae bacterium]|jgi:peroxiredoxin|nr:TlpA disulfide reductase family protein [Prolixibacteraceae bacterium]
MRVLILLCLFITFQSSAQKISGTFQLHANQQIRLEGFNGFGTYVINTSQSDENGNFTLNYSPKDYGMGYLMSEDEKSFILVLGGENIKLKGEAFAFTESVEILEGKENQLFGQYASEQPRREQALIAWGYLDKIYNMDSLFTVHETPRKTIEQEIQRIHDEDKAFLSGLNPDSYVSWFLPVRKMVSAVPAIAQYRTEEIPATIKAFRDMDYTDNKLYKSGLLKVAIESHFWLIENSGRSLDSVYVEMKLSIDHMIENLVADGQKLNEITDYLFRILEQRSLFEASEYLAIKVLNETSCTINSNLAAQLESYRAMKKGNTAPDFAFNNDCFAPGYANNAKPQKLSDIKSEHTVIVFGASWCPKCGEELSKIAKLYLKWKTQGVEVVFVSLDDNEQDFKIFVDAFPFISLCDYQKWESPVTKAYHVFATPTMYLLGEKQEILLRPNSAAQMDSWVDWFLVKGNK